MSLTFSERDEIDRRLKGVGLVLVDTRIVNGRRLFIEVDRPGAVWANAASAGFSPPGRAVPSSDEIPWAELTRSERNALISEVIAKLVA